MSEAGFLPTGPVDGRPGNYSCQIENGHDCRRLPQFFGFPIRYFRLDRAVAQGVERELAYRLHLDARDLTACHFGRHVPSQLMCP